MSYIYTITSTCTYLFCFPLFDSVDVDRNEERIAGRDEQCWRDDKIAWRGCWADSANYWPCKHEQIYFSSKDTCFPKTVEYKIYLSPYLTDFAVHNGCAEYQFANSNLSLNKWMLLFSWQLLCLTNLTEISYSAFSYFIHL